MFHILRYYWLLPLTLNQRSQPPPVLVSLSYFVAAFFSITGLNWLVNIKPPLQLVQTKFRLVLIPLNIDCTYITKAFLFICSFYIWRPQATRRVGVKSSFNLISKKLKLSVRPHIDNFQKTRLRPLRTSVRVRTRQISPQWGQKSKVLNSVQFLRLTTTPGVSSSRPSQANAIREVEMLTLGPRYKSIFLPAVCSQPY